eukprot:187272-Hanusia_phi.AAC.2
MSPVAEKSYRAPARCLIPPSSSSSSSSNLEIDTKTSWEEVFQGSERLREDCARVAEGASQRKKRGPSSSSAGELPGEGCQTWERSHVWSPASHAWDVGGSSQRIQAESSH